MLLNRQAFGLALGITWAFIVFFIGLAGAFGLMEGVVSFLGELYIGFDATFQGAIFGMVWAMVEGYVIGFLFAWIYNSSAQKKEDL